MCLRFPLGQLLRFQLLFPLFKVFDERGMELVKLCNDRLDRAEQRVNAVQTGAEEITLTPFDAEGAK